MANYRQIHVSIWKDRWFIELNSQEKLLFIYLFSNELASLSGLYEIPIKVIHWETDLSIDFIKTSLTKFEKDGKVYYRDGLIWVKNLRKYHPGSSKVDTHIQNDVEKIPDCELKRMYLAYYRENIPYPENPIPYTGDIPTQVLKDPNQEEDHINGGDPPPTIVLSKDERTQFRNELTKYFLTKTHLPAPKTRTKNELKETQRLWWSPWDEIIEYARGSPDTAKAIIDRSLEKGDGLTIANPNSILKIARSVYAEMNGGGNNWKEGYSSA